MGRVRGPADSGAARCFLIGLVCGLVLSASGASAAPPSIDIDVEPSVVEPGQPATVAVTLIAPNGISTQPTNVVLVLDESGSLSSNEFLQQKTFTQGVIGGLFGRGLVQGGGSLGVVAFGTTARTISGLSSNRQAIEAAVQGWNQVPGGQTCWGCGIRQATSLLDVEATAGERRLVVQVTDGLNNTETSTFDADVSAADAAGISRWAVGVDGPGDVSPLASAGNDPFIVADFATLTQMDDEVVQALDLPGASDVVLTPLVSMRLNASSPVVDEGEVQQEGNQLTWDVGAIGDEPAFQENIETVTLEYSIVHVPGQPCGTVPVHDDIGYSDLEGQEPLIPEASIRVTECTSNVTLKFSRTPRSGSNKLRAKGTVEPENPGDTVVATLFRKKANGKFGKVRRKTVTLRTASTYFASFSRPKPGRCKVKVRYLGDADHLAKTKAKTTKC